MNKSVLFLATLLASANSLGQCEDIVAQCRDKVNSDPLLLGGSVQQLLLLNDTIRLPISLSSNTRYRMAVCSADEANVIAYRVLDDHDKQIASYGGPNEQPLEDGRLLEDEDEMPISFQVARAGHGATQGTTQGTIEATLSHRTLEPICAALAIGFEQ